MLLWGGTGPSPAQLVSNDNPIKSPSNNTGGSLWNLHQIFCPIWHDRNRERTDTFVVRDWLLRRVSAGWRGIKIYH